MAVSDLRPELKSELAAALERERGRLRASVLQLAQAERELAESQGDEGDAGGAPGDVASDLAEQELDLALERAGRRRLAEVEAALERLTDGTYGVCENCGMAIVPERLRAQPWTRYCVRCASEAGAGR